MLIPLLGSGNAPKQLVSYGEKNETDIATGRGLTQPDSFPVVHYFAPCRNMVFTKTSFYLRPEKNNYRYIN